MKVIETITNCEHNLIDSSYLHTVFLKWKKCSKDVNIIFVHLQMCRMLFDGKENWPCLCSKSQALCTRPLHKRVIQSKHMDEQNETIFGMSVFLE